MLEIWIKNTNYVQLPWGYGSQSILRISFGELGELRTYLSLDSLT